MGTVVILDGMSKKLRALYFTKSTENKMKNDYSFEDIPVL